VSERRRSLTDIFGGGGGEMRSGRVEQVRRPTLHLTGRMAAVKVPDPATDEPPHREIIGELALVAEKLDGPSYDSGAE
jgi:hypothetical protein